MPVNLNDPAVKAKKEALRQLQKANFYEPELDNPEGENHIPMDDESESKPEETMQQDPTNLEHALSGDAKKKALEELLKKARE